MRCSWTSARFSPGFWILSLALLTACGASHSAREAVFGPVPADTPLLLVMEPAPAGHFDRRLGRASAEFDAVLELISELEVPDGESDPSRRWLAAIANLFRGRLDTEGLRELGLQQGGYSVLYTDRGLPVFRMELSSGERFLESVRGVVASARGAAPERVWKGRVWWDLPFGEASIRLVGIVDGDVLVVALLLDEDPTAALPRLLGLEPPQTSLSNSSRVRDLQEAYGFTWYLASVDLARLAPQLMDRLDAKERFGAQCTAELTTLFDALPPMYFGMVESDDPDVDASRMVIPLSTPARAEAAALFGPPPSLGSENPDVFRFAATVGLKVGALLDWLRRMAVAIRQQPYVCEGLGPFNAFATNLEDQLGPLAATPIPGLSGLGVAISKLELDGDPEIHVGGLVILGTSDSAQLLGLFGLLSMFSGGGVANVPELGVRQRINLPAGFSEILGEVVVLRSDRLVGLAAGRENGARLQAASLATQSDDGVFARFEYDAKFLRDLERALGDDDDDNPPLARALERMQTAAQAIYTRSNAVYRLTELGIEASLWQRLKP